MKSRWLAAVAAVGVGLGAGEARAEGVLLSSAGGHHPDSSEVRVDVFEQVATTVSEMTFSQGGQGASQLAFALPEGASVVGFSVLREGQWQEAQVTAEDASSVSSDSENAVGSTGLPSSSQLAQYLGGNPFLVDIPALNGAQVKVRLTYIQLLTSELSEVRLSYPIQRAPSLLAEKTSTSISVKFQSSRPIQGYGATGYAAYEQLTGQGDGWREVRYDLGAINPIKAFDFRYGLESSYGLYARLLTHHERCDEDGFFLLILEPPAHVDEEQVIPKHFSFVMDISGSMAGTKLTQAKAGAQAGVGLLADKDQFNVTVYSTGVESLFPSPAQGSSTNREKASAFIDKQWAEGGTNIHGAMTEALQAEAAPGTARVMVMLTDGQPTAGETDPFKIVQKVKAANQNGTRVFTFGIGSDVNQQLLSDLAVSNSGEARFVGASDNIAEELSRLFKLVSRPVLTDATTSFSSVSTREVFPEGPRDLFAGAQLLVLGRFQGGGVTKAALDGTLFNSHDHQDFSVEFPSCAQDNPFLPRLWAKAKIDALLARIAEMGTEDPALVQQIEELGKRYGIQTPYSSFSVSVRPGVDPPDPGFSPGSNYGSPSGARSGALDNPGCQASPGPLSGSSGIFLGLAALVAARRRVNRRG